MKRAYYFVILLAFIACSSKESYDPSQLSSAEQNRLMHLIIRYAGDLPPRVAHGSQFGVEHNDFYEAQLKDAVLEKVYKKDGYYFFLVSQSAPSIAVKRHATGGKIKFTGTNAVEDYEEIFRTWKMFPDTLKARGAFLFNKMVKGENLSSYYAKNAGADYIEVPDERTYYSSDERKWKVRN